MMRAMDAISVMHVRAWHQSPDGAIVAPVIKSNDGLCVRRPPENAGPVRIPPRSKTGYSIGIRQEGTGVSSPPHAQ